MIFLIICALFFLRLVLVQTTKYLNIKLLYLPKIRFIFKSMGVLVISYIYYLLYLLYFSVISKVILLSTMCIFFFQSTFFILGFNFLLYYWFIGEKITLWIQRVILSRQIYFILLAGISFGLVKIGFVIEQNSLIFEMERIFTLALEKEVNDFDFSSSVEDRFILGAQYFWLYLFVSFISFFCNSNVLLSEKILCVLFGPYFPGIGHFSNSLLIGVKELEGIKLIVKKGFNFESKPGNARIQEILQKVKINSIETKDQLFTNLVLFNINDKEKMKDVENGELVTFIAKISNLVKSEGKTLIPTKHFKPFEDYLEIKLNLVKFKSFSYLNDIYKGFQKNQERIPSLKSEIEKEGIIPFRIHLSQSTKNGKYLNLTKEELNVIDPQLRSLALDDIYNNSVHIDNLDKTELLLTDGDQRNPLNNPTHYMLKLQLAAALIVKEDLALPHLIPTLDKGQGEYETIFNQQTHYVEIKVESHPKNKEEVLKDIKKILGNKSKQILEAKQSFIFSFTFPNFSGEFSEEDWEGIKNFTQKEKISEKVSLLTITQFKS